MLKSINWINQYFNQIYWSIGNSIHYAIHRPHYPLNISAENGLYAKVKLIEVAFTPEAYDKSLSLCNFELQSLRQTL